PTVAMQRKSNQTRRASPAMTSQISSDAPIARALPVEQGETAAEGAQQSERKSYRPPTNRASKEVPIARALPVEQGDTTAADAESDHPQYIGRSRDGQPVLRMPSGKTVTVENPSNDATSA